VFLEVEIGYLLEGQLEVFPLPFDGDAAVGQKTASNTSSPSS
jgi:hypothetical protein